MIRITCDSNDPSRSGRRTLARFENGNTDLDREPAISKAIGWLDDMLSAVKGVNLITAIFDIKTDRDLDYEHLSYSDKCKKLIYMLNLVLKEHGLELEED